MGDKLLPNSLELEQTILGILLADRLAMVEVIGKLQPEDFYRQTHQIIFQACLELFEKSNPVDVVSVSDVLADVEMDRNYILELAQSFTTATVLEYSVKRLREISVSRQVILAGLEISGYEGEQPLEHAQSLLQEISTSTHKAKSRSMAELQADALANLEEEAHGVISGSPTGFQKLDRVIGGLKPSDLIIVAARPSMGKTALAVNLASNVALRNQQPVLVFTLEMSDVSLVQRILVSEAEGKTISKIRQIQLPEHYRILDVPGAGLNEVRASVMRAQMKMGPLGLVVIDYLQLMGGQGENQNIRISNLSRGLKTLAREFKIPVMCLSQLSRNVEQRQDKRPMLSDLRDSGAIEQDADIVMMIYRDEYYNASTEKPGKAEIIIAKNRNGPVSTVELNFWPAATRFFETGETRCTK